MATKRDAELVRILIASPLEADQVERISTAAPERTAVIYDPTLLPVPRWSADHVGVARELGPMEITRWRHHLASADISFDVDWFEPARMPANAPKLRWVQTTGAGIVDILQRNNLTNSGIVFTTAAGVHAVPLAEHAVMGLLYLVKAVPRLRVWQAAHHWQHYTCDLLSGRRVLVIGLGHIGRQISRSLAALGVDVWGTDPYVASMPDGVSRVIPIRDLGLALPDVDGIVIACPKTPETYHLVGAPELAAMKPSAVLVNVGRGTVVEEGALIRALQEGRLAGAVLDVFENEPLASESPLWDLPQVLISPHSAATASTENALIVDLFIENLNRYLRGRPLLNVFDTSRGF
jgi:phosphoglycerate dehydrogenase-like enzyme